MCTCTGVRVYLMQQLLLKLDLFEENNSMVDYSKWDALAKDLSDDEEDPKGPVVHHVENGGRVTIGPDGATLGPAAATLESSPLKQVYRCVLERVSCLNAAYRM